MSPEQTQGDAVDFRTDIYSLGCVMFEVLTGQSPFAAENAVKVILKHIHGERQALFPILAENGVPSSLQTAIVTGCLHQDPGKRFQTIDQLKQELWSIGEAKGKSKLTIKPAHRYAAALLLTLAVAGSV